MADEDRLAEILGEAYERLAPGEEIDLEALVAEHPDLAEEIEAHLGMLSAVDRVVGGERPDLPEGVPPEIGEYRLVREIGRGGMGVVYEAEQASMERRVALKVLSPSVTSAVQSVQRFQQEAKAAGKLHHSNIVPVYGMGVSNGLWYYAMELVEGRSLGDVVAERKDERDASTGDGVPTGTSTFGREQFVDLAGAMAGVAEALQLAHDEGIIHRDVKPTNLLVAPDGSLRLVDFGLARLAGEGASMTVTGQILGTPHYMSPEQAMARQMPIDHRTDVYSLGATIYEALTLATPFTGDSLPAVCSAILHEEPSPAPRGPPDPRDLETIVLKAMEKDPDGRYPSAGELAKDLRRFAEGMPISARRIGLMAKTWRKVKRHKVRAALAAAVVMLVVVGGLLGLRASREEERRTILEYEALCAEAEDAIASSNELVATPDYVGMLHVGQTARDVYTEAIQLRPDRPEAWFGRALAPGRTFEERLADLDAARECGLSEGTWRLGRAHLLRVVGRSEEAEIEASLAPADAASPSDCYFCARLLTGPGQLADAEALLDRAIEGAEGAPVHHLARQFRALVRIERGNHSGALEDLLAMRAAGDESSTLHLTIADVWRRMGQKAQADAEIDRGIARARRLGDSRVWVALARACRKEKAWFDRVMKEALERHGEHYDLLLERCVWFGTQDQREEGLELARQLVVLDPERHDSHCQLANARLQLALTMRDRRERVRWLEASKQAADGAVASDPDCPNALHRRGLAFLYLGRAEEALADIDRLIENRLKRDGPQPARAGIRRLLAGAYTLRGDAHRMLGNSQKALDACRVALELDDEWGPTHVVRSQALRGLGRMEEAVAPARRAVELIPQDPCSYRALGDALHDLRKHEEAISALLHAVDVDRRAPTADRLRQLAVLYRCVGKFGEARPYLDRILESDPDDVPALSLRAHTLAQLNDAKEALEDARRAVDLDPESGEAREALGFVLRALGQPENALEEYNRAVELMPESGVTLWQRASTLHELKQMSRALEDYNAAARLEHDLEDDSHFLRNRGSALLALHHLDRAEADFRRGIEIDPENAPLRVRLGRVFLLRGQREAALRAFDEAVRLNPSLAEAHEKRGTVLRLMGDYEEALKALDTALELDDGYADAHLSRAGALFGLGRHEKALEAMDRALELGCTVTAGLACVRAQSLIALRRHREALEACEKAVELDPSHLCPQRLFALTCLHRYESALAELEKHEGRAATAWLDWQKMSLLHFLGRDEEAREIARRHVDDEPGPGRRLPQAWICAFVGESAKAREHLAALGETSGAEEMYNRACVYALLGDADESLRWLDRASEAGHRIPADAPPDPDFKSLEKDPKYQALLGKLRSGR